MSTLEERLQRMAGGGTLENRLDNMRTGAQNAPSSSAPMVGLGRRKTPEEIIAQNRIAAQKTGAPVLGEGFNRRVIAKSSRGEQKGHIPTKQSALGGGAGRGSMTQAEAAAGVHAAQGHQLEDFSAAKLVGGAAVKGIDSAMSGITGTADWLLGQNITGAGKLLGQDWSNNPISALNRRVQQAKETNQAYFQPNVERGGRIAEAVDKYGTATAAAIPQAMAAIATAGGSMAAQGTTTGLQAVSAAAKSGGVLSAAQNIIRNLAKDPQYWLSFSQVAGDSYQRAKADGASDAAANLYALANGLGNAAVEVGGGIQTLPKELQKSGSALKAWAESMVDEGKEEVAQGILERGLQNLIYHKNNQLASLTDEDAVLNPRTAAEEFAGGAVVGGILGGGQTLINRAVNPSQSYVKLTKDGVKLEGIHASEGAEQRVLETVQLPQDVVAQQVRNVAAMEKELETQRAIHRNIYAEFRSTDAETRRPELLDEAVKNKTALAQAEQNLQSAKNQLIRLRQKQEQHIIAREAKAKAIAAEAQKEVQAREAREAVSRKKDLAARIVSRYSDRFITDDALKAVEKTGVFPKKIAALKAAYEEAKNTQSRISSLWMQLNQADSLEESIRIKQKIDRETVRLDGLADAIKITQEEIAQYAGEIGQRDAASRHAMIAKMPNPNEMAGINMGQQKTAAPVVGAAESARIKNMKALPESKREPVSQADLDELWQLWEDQANPVTDSATRKEEALAEADNMIKTESTHQKQTLRDSAEEARSYFMRKMVDAGDSVSKVQKLTGDQYLYDYYNMARASTSAGINMINGEQTDIAGMRVGESLNDIFGPIREKGKDYYSAFEKYLYHLHNIDRMSIVNGENTAKLEAEAALSEFDRENPDIATVTEARLQRKAERLDQDAELARERLSLLRKVNQADRLGNKPVFGYEVTAEDSREISQRLLREHPEFTDYQKKVRGYIKNLMQYRVDSGLMTKADAEFLEKYYPNYVPTYRETEGMAYRTNEKSVKIGKTVGRAEGGNTELIPLHEALGRQSMQVVREGSKNRFGQRLLDDWNNHPQQAKKYISDVQKYDAGFSADTFDSLDVDPALQKNNTFFVYRAGKLYEMAVDPSLFDAVKALSPDKQETNKLVRGIMAGNKLFKELVTGYNPTFTVRNTVRDLQTAGLYSRDLTAFAKNYPLALKEIASEGPFWKQYKALGGSFSSIFDYQTGTVKESSRAVQKTLGRVEALNMTMEQAPRLAEFMSIVKKGDGSMENLMDAMHAAADVTVNFGRAGTLGKVLNANYVPFLNPGIQGFSRMIRRVTETKGAKEWAKLAVRAAAIGVAPALLNALIYQDDKDWDDLRDSDKDTNYLFKIGDGMWLKLPKGRELSVLGMTGQRVSDMVKGKEVDWGDFIATVGNQVLPANPLMSNILYAAVSADLLDRKSPGKTWYGGNIESQRLQSYAPGQRYDSSTDIFSKWLGGKLNLSPKKINYILDQYSGVVGDFVLPLLTPQAERNAFAKAFTVDSVSSNRISSDFYNQGEEITYAKNDGDTSMQVVSRFWNKQVTACGKIYAKIRDIENSSSLTDAEKREEVRKAKAVLNGIQKNAMATLETYQSAVKRHLKGSSDDALDTAYREANRDCFGAEYALQVYNKETYKKARMANQNGVSYDDFYRYYFDTQDFASKNGKSADTQKMEYLESSNLKGTTKAELYFADLASDSDLMKQAELEKSHDISPVQYWNYKMATKGMTLKEEKLDAINTLNLTVPQKDALYFANGWARSTIIKAPWYDIEPKLDRMVQGSSRGGRKTTVATMPRLIPGTTLNQYGLDKYRLK